ncbi:MAG: S-layer homology domain-containing protein [Clostridia bacterium]|nr:S-layer homology domain-containing protein [Clostridia bacterium]
MKIAKKRILSLLLSAALLFSVLPMTAMAEEALPLQASGEPVIYLDDKGMEQTCNTYTALTAEYILSNSSTLTDGWYVVDSTFAYNSRVTISGNVHIILTDSADMTASKGITVTGSNSLTIYGQSKAEKMGKLIATGGDDAAGIGGGDGGVGGIITINGGTVTAIGGVQGSGIGGGDGGAGGNITINGGMVTATSNNFGAGIGGGLGGAGGTIVISGDAEVKATGGSGFSGSVFALGGGAGIGSGGGISINMSDGNSPASGNITISGNANVTAQGGGGDSFNAVKAHGGAGIGSGGAAGTGSSADSLGTITINTTGTVNATGGAGDNNGANPGAYIGAGGSQGGAGTPYCTITIDTQPAGNTTVIQGNITDSLSVSASASPSGAPAYEWFSSSTNSNTGGVTTGIKIASFTIPTDLAAGDHYYYCVVSAVGAASVPSDVATVTVTAALPTAHTITASVGANGSISPSGSISVSNGANQAFAITPNSGYSIRAVKVDGTSVGTVSTYTFSNVTGNHTIHAEFYYSYSGGGGGSRGDTSTILSTNVATDKQPDMPTVAKINISGTVKDGVLSASITEQMVKDAIKAAQDAAKKSGKEADGIAVEFTATGSGTWHSVTVDLDAGVIDRLKEAGVKSVKIGSTVLDITLGTGAIAEIDKQSTGTVTVSVTRLTKLSTAAKRLIGNRPAFNITVGYQKNGKPEYVSNFGAGIVTLGFAYAATDKENKGNLFGVYVDKNGKPQLLTNSSYDNIGRLIFNRNSLSTYGVGYKAPSPAFIDTTKHWAKDTIDFVASRNLISGTSTTTFAPNAAITRADFLMALGRLSGADVSIYKTSGFTDVKDPDTAMPFIEWAVKNKIVKGIGGGKFGPGEQISRQDMAVMMVNYAAATGYKLPMSRQSITFADDAKISAYAKAAVKAIQQTGVVSGKDNNLFDPQGSATRAEASAILRRFVELVIDEGTARGWVQNDAGQWQYIGENGKPVVGWLSVENGRYHYYFTADGIMVAGKWLEIEGKWYYFNADGSLAKDTKVDGYAVDENGVRKIK